MRLGLLGKDVMGQNKFIIEFAGRGTYNLYYKEEAINVPFYVAHGSISQQAWWFVLATTKYRKEIINWITDPYYRQLWIDGFGDKYGIPDDWLIETIINNV